MSDSATQVLNQAGGQSFFDRISALPKTASEAFASRRTLASAIVAGALLPTTREEEWKYTNLRDLGKVEFGAIGPGGNGNFSEYLIDETSGSRLVFVNGRYNAELSSTENIPAEAAVFELNESAGKMPETLEKHLGAYAKLENDPFLSLNASLLGEGAFIYVPQDVKVEKPIHLIHISTETEQAFVSAPRVVLVAGRYAKATLIEDYIGIGNGTYLQVPVTELSLDEGANITHVRLQRESKSAFHIARVGSRLDKASNYESYAIHLGSKISRSDVVALIDQHEAHCALDGLVMVGDDQVSDTHTLMDHQKPYCTSHQLHKCIVDDSARSVFNGKIFVRQAAQRTDSFQENRNLLLSDKGTVDTKPQLEIFADDVKCSHGATIGQLSDDELFYLKSRGLDDASARELLTYGFALEVIENVPVEAIRKQLAAAVAEFTQRHKQAASAA